MKHSALSKVLCGLMALVFVLAICPQSAKADTDYYYIYQYKSAGTAKKNTWYTGKDLTQKTKPISSGTQTITTYYLYKLSVPSRGFITVDTKLSSDSGNLYLCPALSKLSNIIDIDTCSIKSWSVSEKTATYYYPLEKGTYYIYADSSIQFKWFFTKAINKSNYRRPKAQKVSAKEEITICMNDGYEYSRWYKLTLSKPKAITLTFTNLMDTPSPYFPNFQIYYADLNRVPYTKLEDGKCQTEKLPKGTYYIKIRYTINGHAWDSDSYSRLFKFSWK